MSKNIILILLSIGFANLLLSSCGNQSLEGNIIIARVSSRIQKANYLSGDSWRYLPNSQIIIFNPKLGKESLKVITPNYFSALSPSLSFDGTHLLFAGQLKENGIWQIWEMDLSNFKISQVTSSSENCTDPLYLPNGRVLYSKLAVNDSLKAGHSLYTCNIDGSENKRITFNPSTYFASNVLNDGRVLTIGKQIYPQTEDQVFMILRPDGSKVEMFYKGNSGSSLITNGRETHDGKIVFIESENSNQNEAKLISINYNRPLHSKVDISHEVKGDYRSVFPELSGKLLVSYRKSDSERYSLYEIDPQNKTTVKEIYSDNEFDVLDAIVIGQRNRAKKLPSEIDLEVKTGLLLCQDINVSDIKTDSTKLKTKASKIELLGLDSSLGVVDVEADGSFYLKVIADKPFRILTLDKEGKILRGPGSWIWVRPNERRACVGCHADPELAPKNVVPLSVKKKPVLIPIQLN